MTRVTKLPTVPSAKRAANSIEMAGNAWSRMSSREGIVYMGAFKVTAIHLLSTAVLHQSSVFSTGLCFSLALIKDSQA